MRKKRKCKDPVCLWMIEQIVKEFPTERANKKFVIIPWLMIINDLVCSLSETIHFSTDLSLGSAAQTLGEIRRHISKSLRSLF